ncbi:MAG: tRNA (cytidine(56)-2'-O)-methyltransferase [Salinirussus sp.]
MEGYPDLTVLRLGHRPGRDERMTTHVGLTARALGADRVVLAGPASDRAGPIREVTDRFGGPFEVGTTDDPVDRIDDCPEAVVHLTMYGLPMRTELPAVRAAYSGDADEAGEEMEGLVVVVGAEKVPWPVYEAADWNLAVTNQPHSEVASLAVFLDRLFEGEELDREWHDADRRVLPRAVGKRVEEL